MIPISLCWDTQKRSVLLKWNGVISSGWKNGKVSMKIFGLSIPVPLKKKKILIFPKIPIKWIYLRDVFSFLTTWKIKRVEGSISFQDPMINGVLYGWMSAIQAERTSPKIHVRVNFLGENWCRGEVTLSLKILFRHLRKWVLPLIRAMRTKNPGKEGKF